MKTVCSFYNNDFFSAFFCFSLLHKTSLVYEWKVYVAVLGAYMGLFLGASFCTCFEIFSLIITICLYTCRLTKKNIELKKEEEETRKKTGLSSPKKSAIPRATKLKTTNIDAA